MSKAKNLLAAMSNKPSKPYVDIVTDNSDITFRFHGERIIRMFNLKDGVPYVARKVDCDSLIMNRGKGDIDMTPKEAADMFKAVDDDKSTLTLTAHM